MAANDVRNIEGPTDLFQQKIVYRKTSIHQEMLGEKMFCGKCSCKVIRARDENSWKTSS